MRLLDLPRDILLYLTDFFEYFEAVPLLTISSQFHDLFARAVWHVVSSKTFKLDPVTRSAALARYGHLVRLVTLPTNSTVPLLYPPNWHLKLPHVVGFIFVIDNRLSTEFKRRIFVGIRSLVHLHYLIAHFEVDVAPYTADGLASIIVARHRDPTKRKLIEVCLMVRNQYDSSSWDACVRFFKKLEPLNIPKLGIGCYPIIDMPPPSVVQCRALAPHLLGLMPSTGHNAGICASQLNGRYFNDKNVSFENTVLVNPKSALKSIKRIHKHPIQMRSHHSVRLSFPDVILSEDFSKVLVEWVTAMPTLVYVGAVDVLNGITVAVEAAVISLLISYSLPSKQTATMNLLNLPRDILLYLTDFFTDGEAFPLLTVSSQFHDLFACAVWRIVDSKQFALDSVTRSAALARYGHLVRSVKHSSVPLLYPPNWHLKLPHVVGFFFAIDNRLGAEFKRRMFVGIRSLINLRRLTAFFIAEEAPYTTDGLASIIVARHRDATKRKLFEVSLFVTKNYGSSPWDACVRFCKKLEPLNIPRLRVDGFPILDIRPPPVRQCHALAPYLLNLEPPAGQKVGSCASQVNGRYFNDNVSPGVLIWMLSLPKLMKVSLDNTVLVDPKSALKLVKRIHKKPIQSRSHQSVRLMFSTVKLSEDCSQVLVEWVAAMPTLEHFSGADASLRQKIHRRCPHLKFKN
ncbi:hypothetical protein GQ42DRAFT_176011 [Ramicandelaber brevisporus]|nr:hypothetical protein GQ42DRAFT_176011 [Ramicandelaber brevisporus]